MVLCIKDLHDYDNNDNDESNDYDNDVDESNDKDNNDNDDDKTFIIFIKRFISITQSLNTFIVE